MRLLRHPLRHQTQHLALTRRQRLERIDVGHGQGAHRFGVERHLPPQGRAKLVEQGVRPRVLEQVAGGAPTHRLPYLALVEEAGEHQHTTDLRELVR